MSLEFATALLRRSGQAVDFSLPDSFDTLASSCITLRENTDPDLDLLVLDETQDLQPEWVQAMLSQLKNSGKAVLLEDPEQQLYKDRVAFDLPEAVTIT